MSTEKPHKVICIGFMKTGTTTLNKALSILGYRVSHNSWCWLKWIVRKDWDAIKTQMSKWDAVEDNPIPLIYPELDQMFPGSKFILTVRDPEEWYNSVAYHIGDLRSPMHAWLFGKGKSLPKNDKAHTLAVYNNHIAQVNAYFKERPEDLLILNTSRLNAWNELCEFLGEDIPTTAFPHANRTVYNQNKHHGIKRSLNYWKKRVINPVKIMMYDLRGFLPQPTERLKT